MWCLRDCLSSVNKELLLSLLNLLLMFETVFIYGIPDKSIIEMLKFPLSITNILQKSVKAWGNSPVRLVDAKSIMGIAMVRRLKTIPVIDECT